MNHYKTPDALRQDCTTLADDARELLNATAEVADEKVAAARRRLESALETAKQSYAGLRERAADGAKVADQTVREHPYEAIAIAFGVGALVGMAVTRR